MTCGCILTEKWDLPGTVLNISIFSCTQKEDSTEDEEEDEGDNDKEGEQEEEEEGDESAENDQLEESGESCDANSPAPEAEVSKEKKRGKEELLSTEPANAHMSGKWWSTGVNNTKNHCAEVLIVSDCCIGRRVAL